MPLECLILKKTLKGPNSKLTLVHSFYCIVELFDVCVLMCQGSQTCQVEEQLSSASKVRDTKANWNTPRSLIEYLLDCLSYLLLLANSKGNGTTWIITMISRRELHCGFVSLPSSLFVQDLAILLLPSTLTQAKLLCKH